MLQNLGNEQATVQVDSVGAERARMLENHDRQSPGCSDALNFYIHDHIASKDWPVRLGLLATRSVKTVPVPDSARARILEAV
jgi:hypothetical protein